MSVVILPLTLLGFNFQTSKILLLTFTMTLNSQLSALLVFHRAVVLLLLTHTSADSVPCPAIEIIKGPNEVKLQCKSADKREAAVLWQDSVGHRIPSQESTNISSSVTVDKKLENQLACKLQRDDITQTLRIFLQRAAMKNKQKKHSSLLEEKQQDERLYEDAVEMMKRHQNEVEFQRQELKAQLDGVEMKRAENQDKLHEETTNDESTEIIQLETNDLERSKRLLKEQLYNIDKLLEITSIMVSSLVSRKQEKVKKVDQVDIGGAEEESSVTESIHLQNLI
ncbi:uncharacterized protein LOC143010630 isoform X3 [Genypterus blacodes]|uniref:uncharacterized protein LOC143010630 isoform X3 n=1 Tax=Genypterus blacodes TaxID=154954 RepID=UPI003F758ECC